MFNHLQISIFSFRLFFLTPFFLPLKYFEIRLKILKHGINYKPMGAVVYRKRLAKNAAFVRNAALHKAQHINREFVF